MPFEYICDRCGKPIERPQRFDDQERHFCSTECYHLATRTGKVIPCPVCGKETYFSPSQVAQGRRFCSWDCWRQFLTKKHVTKVCPVCGKSFTIPPGNADRYTVCSIECRLSSTVYVECERCGKLFANSESRYPRHYCSEECRRPPHYIECRNCGKKVRICPGDTDRQFCSFACYRSFQGETLPEKHTRHLLEALELEFIQEAQVGRYSIDFLLPSLRVALEIDGLYWHQDKRRDRRKTRYLESRGWHVVRITDAELADADNSAVLLRGKLQAVAGRELPRLQPSLF